MTPLSLCHYPGIGKKKWPHDDRDESPGTTGASHPGQQNRGLVTIELLVSGKFIWYSVRVRCREATEESVATENA